MSDIPSMDVIRSWFTEEYRCCTGNSLVEAGQAFDAALAAHDNDLRQDIAEQIAAELHEFGVIADASGACDKAEIWWDAEAVARMERHAKIWRGVIA